MQHPSKNTEMNKENTQDTKHGRSVEPMIYVHKYIDRHI